MRRRTEPEQQAPHRGTRQTSDAVGNMVQLDQWHYNKMTIKKGEKAQDLRERWQKSWDEDSIGRELYRNCSEVRNDVLELSSKAVQHLTGHGNMNTIQTVENSRGLSGGGVHRAKET